MPSQSWSDEDNAKLKANIKADMSVLMQMFPERSYESINKRKVRLNFIPTMHNCSRCKKPFFRKTFSVVKCPTCLAMDVLYKKQRQQEQRTREKYAKAITEQEATENVIYVCQECGEHKQGKHFAMNRNKRRVVCKDCVQKRKVKARQEQIKNGESV